MVAGLAVYVTMILASDADGPGLMEGAGETFPVGAVGLVGPPTIVTVAASLPETGVPSLSNPETVAVLVSTSPALPLITCVNVHLYTSPGTVDWGIMQLPLPFKSPNVSVSRLVRMTGSVELEVFLISKVYVTVAPGAVTVTGRTEYVTMMLGSGSMMGVGAATGDLVGFFVGGVGGDGGVVF